MCCLFRSGTARCGEGLIISLHNEETQNCFSHYYTFVFSCCIQCYLALLSFFFLLYTNLPDNVKWGKYKRLFMALLMDLCPGIGFQRVTEGLKVPPV